MTAAPSVAFALRIGFAEAVALWPATSLLALLRAAGVLAGAAGSLAWVFAFVRGEPEALLGIAGVLLAAWLIAWLSRGLVYGGALRQAQARLRGELPPPLLGAILSASPRVLGYLLWAFWLEVLATGWRSAALLTAGWAYALSLLGRGPGLLGALALSLAVVGALALGGWVWLWTQAALVRAVARDQGYARSLWELATLRGLLARKLGLLLILAGAALLAAAVVNVPTWLLGLGASGPWFPLGKELVAGTVLALPLALLDAWRLHGLLALELSEGEPQQAPPERSAPALFAG